MGEWEISIDKTQDKHPSSPVLDPLFMLLSNFVETECAWLKRYGVCDGCPRLKLCRQWFSGVSDKCIKRPLSNKEFQRTLAKFKSPLL